MSEPTFEYLGAMRVHHPDLDPKIDVTVEGVPESVALEIPWGPIIDLAIKVGGKIFGGGGGGGGKGCVKTQTTLPDGSTVTTEYCPPPA
ncbi:MAG: hypothetical protein ABI662_10865 [Dermatophilaceae bacterium]